MSEQAVLYDAPGPRARRVTLITSVLAAVAVAALGYLFVYLPLQRRDQFSMEKWGPLVDPTNEFFSQVWQRLGEGFQATLTAAAVAIVCSLIAGTALAILRVQLKALVGRRFAGASGAVAVTLRVLIRVLNGITRLFVEVFRGIPVVITIFFVWVGLSQAGVTLGDGVLGYLVIGLTIYNGVVIGEILRSGMEGLPSGQKEAADAIGLTPLQTTWLVLLPQAFRIMLPALISQLVVVLKDTSLGFIITYEDVLRISSTAIIPTLGNPLQTYFVVGVIFITVNYVLSRLAQYTQRRLARGRKAVPFAEGVHAPAAIAAEVDAVSTVEPVHVVAAGATTHEDPKHG